MTLLLLFVVLIGMILAGLPVLLAMGIIGLVGMLVVPDIRLALYPQRMFSMLDSFSLLALPYFILAGELMWRCGLSRKLVDFAETIVGHLRGGLAQTNVMASMVFAGVSGSSTADTSAIGSILIPAMKERGFKPGYAAAITATSGTIGAIIPPSMTMIVYGSMANVSIGGLFLGGIIPGVLVGLALMGVVWVQSFSPRHPELHRREGSFRLRVVLVALAGVWPALLVPVIIIGGILGGAFTATEAGVIACVYTAFLGLVYYRTIGPRDIPGILVRAAMTTAIVSGIIGIAGAFGWLLAYLNFNRIILASILRISDDPTVVMLLLAGAMLVLTMFVDSMAILIISVPIAVHIGAHFAIDPFQLGLMMVMATQIGSTTPPVAVLLFVATSIAKCDYQETIRYCWPFILAEIAVLLLVIFVEPVAAALPAAILRR